ncbi:DUF2237 family protein [Devosia psychrophila]|uniref:DUF2237 domain-containing protein n=1 Tax=Devosia psychrophila TaxID=728005 RepID=A0A0F5PY40_9HYPH|nr:DUF2237 domain-containing protein [Devosia psychrophila]KKC33553.1 hypothetical protein WH91_07555 [Devosia psychrophila]SFC58645.1 hypothetical protein SAMN04488059_10781 [Devosia psychrophila]
MNEQGRFEGPSEYNVLGEALQPCSSDPLTGFFRTGYCAAGPDSGAVHLVCIQASDAFLAYSKSVGNDLSTAMPQFAFPGLVAGDRWCLVVKRWLQAHEAGKAPRVFLRATNQAVLGYVPLEIIRTYALDLN